MSGEGADGSLPTPPKAEAERGGGGRGGKEDISAKGSIHKGETENAEQQAGHDKSISEGGEFHGLTTMKKPTTDRSSTEFSHQGSPTSLRREFNSRIEFNPLDENPFRGGELSSLNKFAASPYNSTSFSHVLNYSEAKIYTGNFIERSDDELIKLVEDMQNEIRHLRMENLIFFHFLEKNDPSMVEDMGNVIKNVQTVKDRVSQTLQRRSLMSHSLTSQRSSLLQHSSTFGSTLTLGQDKSVGPKINLTQRTDLLLREMEEIQTNLETLGTKSHITKCYLRAELEEMSIRESELTEAMDLFESAIVIGGVDPITQKIPLDKYLRYMEEWLKSACLTIDKIRLRTSSFRVQYQKVYRQLIEKEELGVNLTEVDFDQLQIENKNLKEKIEVKTQLLIEMKRMNGTANLNLTIHKKLLQKKIDEVSKIKEAIKAKEDRIVKLDSDCDAVNDELEAAKDIYFAVKDRVESYTVPEVIDYVKAKAELGVLKKNIKIWTRRKNIKEMALNSCIQEIKAITACGTVRPSWFVMPQDSVSSSTESFHFGFEIKPRRMTRRSSVNPRPRTKSNVSK